MTEFSAAEIAAGCPLVLIAQETSMRARREATLADVDASVITPENLIGLQITPDGPLPICTPGAELHSRRRLGSFVGEVVDLRVVRPVPLAFIKLDDCYEVGTDIGEGQLKGMLQQNVAPCTDQSYPEASFVAFQTFPPLEPRLTRGGFLGKREGDVTLPLVTTIEDKKYIVDVKGIGGAEGGFHPYSNGFFNRVLFGALPAADAQKEYQNLTRAHEAGLTPIRPLAVGSFRLRNGEGADDELGVVFRLTPSTLRLSHREIPGAIPIESTDDCIVVVDKMLGNLIDKFFQDDDAAIFLSPASHLENYLVEPDLTITETDFEDFREFGTGELPFVHLQTGTFIDTLSVLKHYFSNFSRVDEFDVEKLTRVVAGMTERKLKARGIVTDLSQVTTVEEIARVMWDEWLVEAQHEARIKHGYTPVDMFHFFISNARYVDELLVDARAAGRGTYHALAEAIAANDLFGGEDILKHCLLYGDLYYTPDLTNGERYGAAAANHDFLEKAARHAVRLNGWTELPESVAEALTHSDNFCELASRLFGSVQFFAKYVASELKTTQQLIAKGYTGLELLAAVLDHAKRAVDQVVSSTDYRVGVQFYSKELPDYMRGVYEAFSVTYGPGQQ